MHILPAIVVFVSLVFSSQTAFAQHEVTSLLEEQVRAWNEGDLNGFMQYYWKSDSLMFIGSGGLHYGWNNLNDRYQKAYADQQDMGQLRFELKELLNLSPNAVLVIGSWHLQNSSGLHEGMFSLNWLKTKDGWKVVCDHTDKSE